MKIVRELCFALPSSAIAADAEPSLPTRLKVAVGGKYQGKDGRIYLNDQPDQVVKAHTQHIPVDENHASELVLHQQCSPQEARAVGWCTGLEKNADGSIDALITWNDLGKKLLLGQYYRYFSPSYKVDLKTRRIISIVSIALTNRPNLNVPELNHEGQSMSLLSELQAAKTRPDVLAALQQSVGADVAPEQVEVALNHVAGVLRPSVDMVPASDYQAMQAKVSALTVELNSAKQQQHTDAVNQVVGQAIAERKILASSRQYYIECCSDQAGLDRFKQFVSGLQPVTAAEPAVANKPIDHNSATELNADTRAIIDQLGVTPEEYLQAQAAGAQQ
jgi:phage I-like protein